jgi:hypothetical protein
MRLAPDAMFAYFASPFISQILTQPNIASKKIEERSSEELMKMRKTLTAIMVVPLVLVVVVLIYMIYLMGQGRSVGTLAVIVPSVWVAGLLPLMTQIGQINAELKKRGQA